MWILPLLKLCHVRLNCCYCCFSIDYNYKLFFFSESSQFSVRLLNEKDYITLIVYGYCILGVIAEQLLALGKKKPNTDNEFSSVRVNTKTDV